MEATLDSTHIIRTDEDLTALYGTGSRASLEKEVDYIHPHYRDMIEASSFVIIASASEGRLDASPRGDPAGFVVVEDERTLLIPDRRGNNRVDTLHNLVADPRIALLFLIPGVNESLRVNGKAVMPRSALASNGTLLADLSGDREYHKRDATRDQTVRATLY